MLTKKQYEAAIFGAFREACPSIARRFQDVGYPDQDDRADVVTRLESGNEIEWQLGEWLQPAQVAVGKRRESLEGQVLEAVGEQKANETEHILACMLTLREGVRFDAWDARRLGRELYDLVAEVERDWPSNKAWQGPQGHVCRAFPGQPILAKYVASIHFEPRSVRGEMREWPATQPWIFVEPPGGAYDPVVAIEAMGTIIRDKALHYGEVTADFRLIVFYNLGYLYNTPFFGPKCRSFADAAAAAHGIARDIRASFTHVYLLDAPNREAFEVYPTLSRCE